MKKNFFGIAATTLRAGVAISAVFLAAALVDSVVAPDALTTVRPTELGSALLRVFRIETGALVHIGIAVLLLTPIARLLAVTTEFSLRREMTFVLMSVGVLLLLGASVVIGLL